jgi:hypothetical protein
MKCTSITIKNGLETLGRELESFDYDRQTM